MLEGKVIGFIGAGNMGEALICGLVQSGRVKKSDIIVSDINKDRLNTLAQTQGIRIAGSNIELMEESSIVIIAVKPWQVDPLLDEIASSSREDQLFISIIAGAATGRFSAKLHPQCGVVRAMPNTPASVLAGATALYAGKNVSSENLQDAVAIFDCAGKAVVAQTEALMDAVTGLSGSGPAYVLLAIEALGDAGVLLGIPRTEAYLLAAQTVYGTAKMLLETGKSPAELKAGVTTPGGTTAAGLRMLEKGGLRSAITDAVEAAAARSRELGNK